MNKKGFTLVEIILYVALVSLFVSSAVFFAWDVIYGREKSYRQQVVQQSARMLMDRISYEVGRAESIVSLSPTSLVLDHGTGTTTIEQDAGAVLITSDGVGPEALTSNEVVLENILFEETSPSTGDSQGVRISFTLVQSATSAKGELTAETSLESAYNLKGQVGSAQGVLVDTSSFLYSAGTVSGITLESDYTATVTEVSVRSLGSTSPFTDIQLDGGASEWSGSLASGETADIADFSLTPGTPETLAITFGADIAGDIIEFDLVMSDNSKAKGRVYISP